MATWQVQQAKMKLSEVIADAQTKGPQIISKHGTETAVVLSMAEYRKLSHRTPESDLIRVLLHDGPKFEDDDNPFEDLRDPYDFGRDIDL
jgi:prevent-host-death family protein